MGFTRYTITTTTTTTTTTTPYSYLQQLDLPELVDPCLDVELVAHGVVREVMGVHVDLDAALATIGVDLARVRVSSVGVG